MDARTLIIGANSRLGCMLRRSWHDRNNVSWLARTGTGPVWALKDGASGLRPIMKGADVVVCLAGATPYEGVPFSVNQALAMEVLTAAERCNVPPTVLLASTQAVYGDGAGPHLETGPVAPGNAYGQSKLLMEQVARKLAKASGVKLCCLRLANVVGADMLLRNIAAGQSIVLDRFADGRTPIRSYLDPESLGIAFDRLIGLARSGDGLPTLLNVATDPAHEMAELLREARVDFETRPAPSTARPKITMETGQLKQLVPALAEPRSAAAVIAAWRRFEALG